MKRKILCMVLFISLLASFIYLDEANAQSITFDESLIEESYPANNQGAADDEKVEINPLIRIKFKEKVELADASKITLSSDGHVYSFDSYNDIWVTYDGYTLKIDINSLHRSGVSPLRANTAYKLTIGKGALRLNEFYYPNTKEKIQNEEINLYFITGTHTAPSDSGLRPVKYTSSISPDYDDITNLNTTKLNNIKKTKISLYPEGELKAGRYYELIIPSEVFTARNDKPLDGIILNFAVEGNGLLERGIYKFEITNKPNRPLLVTDFESDKDDFEFTITGYNFAEDIKQLRFVRESDGKTITIPKSYLTFHDVTKITGKISGSAKSEFARVTASGEYGIVKSSAGAYDIYIDFDRGSSAGLTTVTQRLVVKDRPKVISTIPYDGERYFDPELLYREFSDDEGGYYIIVEFEDIGGTLGLTDVLNHGIEVKSQIDGTNLVDRTKPLKLEKEGPVSGYRTNKSILYIPIVEKLKDGQTYEVLIPASTVVEYSDVTTGGNRGYKWTFDTNYLPKADRLYEGSVPEYYDEDYSIVIEGSMFNKNTVVRFRHSSGRTYYPYDVEIIDDNKLYIYLPIRPRLPVGLYDLIISNGDNYNTEMVYGVFSVVEEGDYVPNEEYRIKSESYLGTVKEIKKISIDVLELNPRRANSSLLEIDLDELMGTETWARNIEYPANWRDTLGTLILKSKWANIEIYNLRLKDDAEERYIILRTGRAEPALADSIKMKLIGYSIKSNLIEVSGENFEFSWLLIEIPYFESDGINLKMLRYDELTRQFVEVPAAVEFVDGKVIGYTDKPGIFIVVE